MVFKNNPYYHGTIRRVITAFGQFFSGITLEYWDGDRKEKSIVVPIAYGPKNKWLERIRATPKPEAGGVAVTLPRMSFEIVDYRYDPQRKVGTQGSSISGNYGGGGVKLFNPVPYDLTINMYTLAKDNDDSLKILEQILPYFAPNINITVEVLPELGIKKKIPIVLNSVSTEDTYDGSPDLMRTVVQTFVFTAKVDLFGPIKTGGVIKNSTANISPDIEGEPMESLNYVVDPFSAGPDDPHTIIETRTTL